MVDFIDLTLDASINTHTRPKRVQCRHVYNEPGTAKASSKRKERDLGKNQEHAVPPQDCPTYLEGKRHKLGNGTLNRGNATASLPPFSDRYQDRSVQTSTRTPGRMCPRTDVELSYQDFSHRFRLRASSGSSQVSIEDSFCLTYTSSDKVLQDWIDALPKTCTLGFDTEGSGCVTQLCCLSRSCVLIFAFPVDAPVSIRQKCTATLSGVLSSKRYLKVGIAAFDDAVKLTRHYDITCAKIFDLTYLSRDLQISPAGEIHRRFIKEKERGIVIIDEVDCRTLPFGLKTLFQDLFHANFGDIQSMEGEAYPSPCEKASQNKWSQYPISLSDLRYAAKDAIFGVLLYNLMISKFTEPEIRDLEARAGQEHQKRLRRSRLRSQTMKLSTHHNPPGRLLARGEQ